MLSYGISKITKIPLKYTIFTGYLSLPLLLERETFGLSKYPNGGMDGIIYTSFKKIWWDYVQLYLWQAVSSLSFTKDLNYGFFPPALDIITEHIALGRCPVSTEVDIIKDAPYNIKMVINMCEETQGPIHKYKQYGIEYYNFPSNFEPKEKDVDKAMEIIDKFIENKNADSRVLVHCAIGRHRSATIVLCHLIKSTEMDADKAFEFLKSKRKWASDSIVDYSIVRLYASKYSTRQ